MLSIKMGFTLPKKPVRYDILVYHNFFPTTTFVVS